MTMQHLRIARPVSDLALSSQVWCQGLGLREIGAFTGHQGFSGVMLGAEGVGWHLEFTHCPGHPLLPSPTQEDLLVLYTPGNADWRDRCARMAAAGFRRVTAFNPYWDRQGVTFSDRDGYRVVIQRGTWPAVLS